MSPPTGRLAPSPTGRLHLGHARSFLLAWWSVRARGGAVRLRIEDLDVARAKPELVDLARRDLEWLGLDWDGAPLVQSADLAPYREALERLLERGRAYPCVCTRREVQDVASAPHPGPGVETRYPGTCRGRFRDPPAATEATGRAAGVRLAVPDGPVAVRDALAGAVAFDVQAEVGDFLLARRDGVVAYQLAVVVDDARQGVTEVLRGDDLLPSAARQALLQDALGLPRPRWVHVPLVVGDDGARLAKRDGALALESLRAEGVDPRAIVAWAARSVGLDVPELVEAGALAAGFRAAELPRGSVRFGAAELDEVRRWRV
jgi:glutamyl-tRNA synthetase